MTRIIAGAARGRRLKVPAAATRPTSDRVREALFSALESAFGLRDAEVLDLFAGSGALGLEALSRGASRAVLVDRGTEPARVMADNARTVGLPGAQVVRSQVEKFLCGAPQGFDIVFLDPPYEAPAGEVQSVLARLAEGWLNPGAVVVVERGVRGADLVWPPGFAERWDRRFGDTRISRAVWYGHQQDRS
ncbi:MAG TPA: 16S rRNA (guanine(966)-N(2))-methyltransferase RsmD [Actinomycetota bacterium]|nr:16S rRNA (guanine(966)-N(2))-methyltransferase RsmD [Actinomycetota bacterium]